MADAKFLDMPMEFRLELMAIIRSDFADAEWELFNGTVLAQPKGSSIFFWCRWHKV